MIYRIRHPKCRSNVNFYSVNEARAREIMGVFPQESEIDDARSANVKYLHHYYIKYIVHVE